MQAGFDDIRFYTSGDSISWKRGQEENYENMVLYLLIIVFACLPSALDGYDYYQEISYTACDQAIYQQIL